MNPQADPICIRVIKTPAVWPLSTLYLGAVATISGITEGYMDVITGIFALGILAVLLLVIVVFREVHLVHLLVNSQRDDLIARIDQLVAALTEAGVSIPHDPNDANDPKSHPPRKNA